MCAQKNGEEQIRDEADKDERWRQPIDTVNEGICVDTALRH